jgi:hypothetical protein
VVPLRRLTRQELAHTLTDLVGEPLFDEATLAFDRIPADELSEVARLSPLHDEAHVNAMLDTGLRVAEAMLSDPAHLGRLGHRCMHEQDASRECVRTFLEEFGLRVFRRPVRPDELDDYLTFYDEAPDHPEGLRRVMMRFFSSPEFLFHVEVEGELEGEALAVDDYVVANRLSYALLGSMPTPALFEAAEQGRLSTPEEVRVEARTVLSSPSAEEAVVDLFERWLETEELPSPATDPAFLDGLPSDGLADAIHDELRAFIRAMLFERDADYRTLMTSPVAYPENDALASIYGVEPWSGEGPAPETSEDRGGLLLRAAMLLTEKHATAPILRGVFVRRRLLCDPLPSPSLDVVNARQEEVGELDPAEVSSREIISAITGADGCQSCHAKINPVSFALSEFDAIGRRRSHERVFHNDGTLLAEHPVDTNTEVVLDGERIPVSSGFELAQAIAESEQGHACFVRRIFEQSHLRRMGERDHCQVAGLYRDLKAGEASLLDVLVGSAASPATLYRTLEQ